MSMSALIAATGAFARVPSRHPSTFFSNISIPVQATTSMSLARSRENASGKVEELPRLVLRLLPLERVQRPALFRYNNDGFRTCSGYEAHVIRSIRCASRLKSIQFTFFKDIHIFDYDEHLTNLLTYFCVVYRWRQRAGI
jgi:hypothetical protein